MIHKRNIPCQLAALAMIFLIFDSKHTLSAASEGLELCIRTVIPSLFPFFVLSGMILPGLNGFRLPWLSKMLHIPQGWESVFLLGCIGGYPVGAQCICQGCRAGHLDTEQAQRMLGLCNNCGPSFLFGVTAAFFPHPGYAAGIMGIGILSAVLTGILWPAAGNGCAKSLPLPPVTLPQAVRQALSSMASVCAWIILGKIPSQALKRCIFNHLPPSTSVLLTGMLELTNGCMELGNIEALPVRFCVAAALCAFGGICVAMQVGTVSAEAGISLKHYLPQKLTQALLAGAIAFTVCTDRLWVSVIVFIVFLIVYKSAVAFQKKVMYNKPSEGGFYHAVPKEN